MYVIIIIVKETNLFGVRHPRLNAGFANSRLQTWISYVYTQAITTNCEMEINSDSTSHRTK